MASEGQDYFKEFTVRLQKLNDQEVIECFNKEVKKMGWGTARASYLNAIHHEFDRRNFNYSAIGDSKALSFKNKVRLINGTIELNESE